MVKTNTPRIQGICMVVMMMMRRLAAEYPSGSCKPVSPSEGSEFMPGVGPGALTCYGRVCRGAGVLHLTRETSGASEHASASVRLALTT